MATIINNGVVFDPSEGSGKSSQTAKLSSPNRGNRTTIPVVMTYESPGAESVDITYQIEAAAEYVSFDNGSSMAVAKGGGTIDIYGKSNSSMLVFNTGQGTLPISITHGGYKVKGASDDNYRNASSGTAISEDPGASATYSFWIQFINVPANTSLNELTNTLSVSTEGNKTATITLTQTAGSPYIVVTPETTTIPQDGSAITIQIDCNGTWQCVK